MRLPSGRAAHSPSLRRIGFATWRARCGARQSSACPFDSALNLVHSDFGFRPSDFPSSPTSLVRLRLAATLGPFVITERLRQHAADAQFSRLPELLNPDRHAVVTCFGLGAIGAEKPVPPWEIEAEIAV